MMNRFLPYQKSKTMKNANQTIGLLVVLFAALQTAQAQVQNVWVGGVPGQPVDWNVASNWSLQQVPRKHHDVVIPNTASTTFSYPVIDGNVEIHRLRLEKEARLVILENGKLHLNCNCAGMKEALDVREDATIENRSKNLIGFEQTVFETHNSNLYTLKRN